MAPNKPVKSPASATPAPVVDGQGLPTKHGNLLIHDSRSVSFTSPLPPADFINEYARINPNAPQVLLDLFVKHTEHRIGCEKRNLEAQITTKKRGQIFGFIFAMSALIAGVIAIVFDHPTVAGGIFLTTIPFCAAVFILGKLPKKPQAEQPKQITHQTKDK